MKNPFKKKNNINIMYIKDTVYNIINNKLYNSIQFANNSYESSLMINGNFIFKFQVRNNELQFINFYADNIITVEVDYNIFKEFFIDYLDNFYKSKYLYRLLDISIIPCFWNRNEYSKTIYDIIMNDPNKATDIQKVYNNLTYEYKEKLDYLYNASKFDLI